MHLPSLNGLRAAEAVGRLGSLARAAADLNVTPGAVSHQLRALEAQLGVALFDRTERGLVPTAAGKALLPRLTQAFQTMADALAEATGAQYRVLTVSCGLAFAARVLVPKLVDWNTRHPAVEIRLVTTSRLVDFDRDDVDVAVRFGQGGWPGVEATLVAPQTVDAVCTPALAQRLHERGATVPLIVDEQSLVRWEDWVAATGVDLDLTDRPCRSIPDAALCYEAALSGQGLWLAWPLLVAEAKAVGRLVSPFDAPMEAGLGYWLVSTPTRWRRPHVQAFRGWLASMLAVPAAAG